MTSYPEPESEDVMAKKCTPFTHEWTSSKGMHPMSGLRDVCDNCGAGRFEEARVYELEQACERARIAGAEPDANCVTTPDGGCTGGPCMHDAAFRAQCVSFCEGFIELLSVADAATRVAEKERDSALSEIARLRALLVEHDCSEVDLVTDERGEE